MSRILFGSLVLAAGLAPGLAGAEAEKVLRLTLEQARQRALSEAPELARARALETAAAAGLRGARAARLPRLDFQAGYTRLSDVPELSVDFPTGRRTLFPNIPDNFRTRLGVAVPLYTGGRLGAMIEAARSDATAAAGDTQTSRDELVLETTSAYWALVTARAREQVLTEGLQSYEAHLTDARNRERFGLAARNEVLAVQVQRDRAELARLRASNAADVAEANLARLVAAPAGTRVEATDSLSPLPSPAAGPGELEGLVASALRERPERKALASRVEAAEAGVRATRSGRLPQVSLQAGYDYANPNRRILPPQAKWDDSWDVGVNLSLNVFDGGRTSAAIAEARARADAVREQLEDLDRRIRLQVTQAALEVRADQEAVRVAGRNLEAARENARVATERHRAGVVPSSERLDAEVSLLAAGLDRTQALAEWHLAAARLDRAVGR